MGRQASPRHHQPNIRFMTAPKTTPPAHASAPISNLMDTIGGNVVSRSAPPLPEVDVASIRTRHQDIWRRAVPHRYLWSRRGELLGERVSLGADAIGAMLDAAGTESVLLVGPSGSGKTSLAAAIVRQVIENSARDAIDAWETMTVARRLAHRILFTPAYHLARASAYSKLGSRPELVTAAVEANLLVLDDLGTDLDVFAQHQSTVREVIHERHAEERPTIVTTYLIQAALEKSYGAGICRRLQDGRVALLGKGSS